MAEPRILALDGMGGDNGPAVVVGGAAIALERHPDLTCIIYGNEAEIRRNLEMMPDLAARTTVVHTDLVIANDAKPSQAMRRGKGSSMWNALEAVRDKRAHFAVSAGNTGALMAMATLLLRPFEGVERPALAAQWPTISRPAIVLDVGANIGADARRLCDFALMGAAMARALFGVERPSVGLLNVGVEEIKGVEEVKQAHAWLKQSNLTFEYKGFVEGDQIGHSIADVIVVEGFAGNIALKTAEGTARQIGIYLKDAMQTSMASKVGAYMARGGFEVLKGRIDPRRFNGGTFLGLNGIAIKSHGGTDAVGFASAIEVGYAMAAADVVARLAGELAVFHGTLNSIAATSHAT